MIIGGRHAQNDCPYLHGTSWLRSRAAPGQSGSETERGRKAREDPGDFTNKTGQVLGKSAVAKAKDMGLSENVGPPNKNHAFSMYQHLRLILS